MTSKQYSWMRMHETLQLPVADNILAENKNTLVDVIRDNKWFWQKHYDTRPVSLVSKTDPTIWNILTGTIPPLKSQLSTVDILKMIKWNRN